MKTKSANAGGSERKSRQKTPRNLVSSPWVHKNQSNIVSRGRPKGSKIKGENQKNLNKLFHKTAVENALLDAESMKVKLALESPVPDENGTNKRSSIRRKSALHKNLNESAMRKAATVRVNKKKTPEHASRKQNGENGFENNDGDLENVAMKKSIVIEEMEVDDTGAKTVSSEIRKEIQPGQTESIPNKDPNNWSCNIL